ncbi:MAG TPA: SDR family oxidoreductase [Solirubrobacteraceae bacterium]|jgi:NAD(P)-dependent dehydrogenase (short-subunit alcohol dehydrogenase family)
MSTENRCILVTGSSSGLGRATALLFAERGWRVVATMRNPQADATLTGLVGVELVQLDTTDPARITDVAREYGDRVNVVFNNAGYGIGGPLEGLTDDQIVRQVNTNLLGTIRVTKAFLPYLRERGSGLFINTSSIGGLVAVPFNSMYHATKWGIEGWSESMAFELGQVGLGIKIIEPGGMKTDFFIRSFDSAEHPAYADAAARVHAVVSNPQAIARYSTPEQVADVVFKAATDGTTRLRYLAGEDAKATWTARQEAGDERFMAAMTQRFFGSDNP